MTNYLTLNEAVHFFPRRAGKLVHPKTVYNRATKGVHGVRLRTIREGAMLMTTEEWIEQFQRECTARAMRTVHPYDRGSYQQELDESVTRRLRRGKEENRTYEMHAVQET